MKRKTSLEISIAAKRKVAKVSLTSEIKKVWSRRWKEGKEWAEVLFISGVRKHAS